MLDQLLELGVAGPRFLQDRNLLGADRAGEVLARLPALQLEIRAAAGRTVLEVVGAELAALPELNLGDLGEQISGGRGLPSCTYDARYIPRKLQAISTRGRVLSHAQPQLRPVFEVDPSRFDFERWWAISTADRRSIHRLATEILGTAPPLLGSGPGTFGSLWSIDPRRIKVLVDLHVHNDWLETRLTFGWIGYGLVLLALATGVGAMALRGGVSSAAGLRLFLVVPLAGCRVHAREDFPLRNHAILFGFLLLVCLGSLLGRPAKASAR